MKLSRADIASLLPHDGAMCLLDSVQSWDQTHIVCMATSHRNPLHPLRDGEVLRAVCGIEYAAQAIAVHRGLLDNACSSKAVGVVGGIRNVVLNVERLDDLAEDLAIRVDKLIEQGGSLMYGFMVSAGDRCLITGRASVMTLNDPTGPRTSNLEPRTESSL